MSNLPLHEALLAPDLSELKDALARAPELSAQLEQALAGGEQAFGAKLPPAVFLRHLQERLGGSEAGPSRALHLDDLYLACACAQGHPLALAELQRRHQPDIDQALRKLRSPSGADDDIRQAVWRRVLVKQGEAPPRIQDYSGRGPLGAWIYAVTVRCAMDQHREARPEDAELDEALEDSSDDPELALIRARCGQHFRQAFAAAFAALDARQRALLRLNFFEKLNIDELGAMYGVHRATVARWIADARAVLLKVTRTELATRLSLNEDELDSLLRAIDSKVEISVKRLLLESPTAA